MAIPVTTIPPIPDIIPPYGAACCIIGGAECCTGAGGLATAAYGLAGWDLLKKPPDGFDDGDEPLDDDEPLAIFIYIYNYN